MVSNTVETPNEPETTTMSTKIYEGLRLAEGVDIFDVNTRLRELLNPVRDRLDARVLVRRAVRAIDHADFNGTPRPRLPILHALERYDEEQRNADWHTATTAPTRCCAWRSTVRSA